MAKQADFLLVGIDGTFNYGGEAIVRGTVRMLRERWPAGAITLATGRPLEDAARLSDIPGLRVIQSRRRWTVKRVLLGVPRRIGIGSGSRLPLNVPALAKHGVVLSIGGDNYGFMSDDHRVHPLSLDLVSLGEKVIRRGGRYVLWGASVGPFAAVPAVEEYFAAHLRKVPLITARDGVTADYLRSLGCGANVTQVADPAFLMEAGSLPGTVRLPGGAVLLALNLSPASVHHVFPGDARKVARCQAMLLECIATLLEKSGRHLLLVPHVVPAHERDNDDYHFLSALYDEIGRHRERVTLLPRNLGAAATKAVLSRCDAVVAARMHCCVAALSAGVPTILLRYSSKALGMARYVYGSDEWCVHVKDLTPALLGEKVDRLLSRRAEIASRLEEGRRRREEDARRAVDALAGLLELQGGAGLPSQPGPS